MLYSIECWKVQKLSNVVSQSERHIEQPKKEYLASIEHRLHADYLIYDQPRVEMTVHAHEPLGMTSYFHNKFLTINLINKN